MYSCILKKSCIVSQTCIRTAHAAILTQVYLRSRLSCHLSTISGYRILWICFIIRGGCLCGAIWKNRKRLLYIVTNDRNANLSAFSIWNYMENRSFKMRCCPEGVALWIERSNDIIAITVSDRREIMQLSGSSCFSPAILGTNDSWSRN